MNARICLVISVFLLAMGCATATGRTIYVDDDEIADFNNIQAAINDANNGDTVIVADGTYTGQGNRDISFGGKAITVKSENGPANCIIDCNGTEADGHRGFKFDRSGEGANSVINGFTIINGCAPYDWCEPPFMMLISVGGAIFCWDTSPTISNCIFSSNSNNVSIQRGGAIYNGLGGPTLTNCTFSGNSDGGLYNRSGNPTVSNCIMWDNTPDQMHVREGSPVVTYSDVEGGWPGMGNIDVAPCFADPCDGDYHLQSQAGRWDPNGQIWVIDANTSPCIDAGDPATPVGFEPFPNGGIINMGAYGGTAEASKSYFGKPPCETIIAGDINGDCKVNFLDFRLCIGWRRDKTCWGSKRPGLFLSVKAKNRHKWFPPAAPTRVGRRGGRQSRVPCCGNSNEKFLALRCVFG